jgi:hypothetical protein
MTGRQNDVRYSRFARRLAVIVGIPLAVLGGARAVSWGAATLKTWMDGDTLTAADINGNFAALAAQQTPANVLAAFNTATVGTANDLRWMMQHAAAGAACAAQSPVGDSGYEHVVLPKPSGVNCTAACAANTGGVYTQCRTTIAIGDISPTQATAYTDVLAKDYNYGCSDGQAAYDEVKGQGLGTAGDTSAYTSYCCCYH